ncbi:MAG: hypothetical protein NXI18_21705 [Alphaproteobacteria bacterium]|nr:hypothetical protein [Alphaproteobacteria bacterium]
MNDDALQNSHIIPEFLYRPGYDEKGRLLELSGDVGRKKLIQKGYRERLLCAGCETHIGRFEKYFADLWYQTDPLPNPVTTNGILRSFDYQPFKLFLLSILWRAGISEREEFSTVRLGPYENELREMLLHEDPGPDTQFQIYGLVLLAPQTASPCHGTIMPPARLRLPAGQTGYEFIFAGVSWNFISSKQTTDAIRLGALSESGTMSFPVRSLEDDRNFTQFMKDYFATRRRNR